MHTSLNTRNILKPMTIQNTSHYMHAKMYDNFIRESVVIFVYYIPTNAQISYVNLY